MYKNLNTGAIGIRDLSLAQTIDLAQRTGYAGIDFDIREAAKLAEAHGVAHVRNFFKDASVLPGLWGLPIAWNDDARWQADMADLPKLAKLGVELGCTRTATWCPSWSDARSYEENFAWHVERFQPITEVLAKFDCRLGIEFLGPKTLRDGHPYGFISTMSEIMELADAIGTGNVGLLLDAWHLFTSGGDVDDLDRVTADDIVTVHINDAPAGLEWDEQIDSVRCLPLETGILNLVGFMQKLDAMGYDGPVTTEPFNKSLNEIAAVDPAAAAAMKVSDAMDELWRISDLAT